MAEKSFESTNSHLLVAAFDFGTTYSGYAFSFRDKPLHVQTNKGWNAGSERLMSWKTPTCVLLNSDKQFHSFGYDAENEYAELALDKNHHGWYLFRNFKMMLHDRKDLTRTTIIEDIDGKPIQAMTLFAMSIKYLRDHLLTSLASQASGILETDIQYVLTVPAIWNDGAKQFMREAAIEAGIDTERLKIALEPEAASIWCQTITEEAKLALSSSGNQYMVVDLGGGTADISVHELKPDRSLKEIHKASGGPWGGTEVDKNYIDMMANLVGEDVMERYKKEQMGDFFDMLRDFEVKKRAITSDKQGKVTFKVASSLRNICKENGEKFKDRIANSDKSSQICLTGDKLRIDAALVNEWFKTLIQSLIGHVKGIFDVPAMTKVNTIVLVGGFGECQLVQEAFKAKFQNKKLIVPNEAGLAVLKGAVKFGHMPTIISTRVLKFTYGRPGFVTFNPAIHPESKLKIEENGKKWCGDIFEVIARAGDTSDIGRSIISKKHEPFNASSTTSVVRIYSSEALYPVFVSDSMCQFLGKLKVNLPEGNTMEDKYFDVTYIFCDTELIIKAQVYKTGFEFKTSLDCL